MCGLEQPSFRLFASADHILPPCFAVSAPMHSPRPATAYSSSKSLRPLYSMGLPASHLNVPLSSCCMEPYRSALHPFLCLGITSGHRLLHDLYNQCPLPFATAAADQHLIPLPFSVVVSPVMGLCLHSTLGILFATIVLETAFLPKPAKRAGHPAPSNPFPVPSNCSPQFLLGHKLGLSQMPKLPFAPFFGLQSLLASVSRQSGPLDKPKPLHTICELAFFSCPGLVFWATLPTWRFRVCAPLLEKLLLFGENPGEITITSEPAILAHCV